MTSPQRFTLSQGHWYGWQMLPGYVSDDPYPYFSPIYVGEITPRKTHRRILALRFSTWPRPKGCSRSR